MHGQAARDETVILQGSKDNGFEDQRFAYEPATPDGKRGSAFRSHNPKDDAAHAEMHSVNKACTPTAEHRRVADRLLRESRQALKVFDNNPAKALAEGFIAYPVPQSKMFHMVSPFRSRDQFELTPGAVESFMYAMTDSGLKAVGAMYMFNDRSKPPPNPTGCILQWHRHTGMQGAISSFDPRNPTTSIWMAHVWTFGFDNPWGDGDGTEPHAWFFAYRNVPAFCRSTGECV